MAVEDTIVWTILNKLKKHKLCSCWGHSQAVLQTWYKKKRRDK